MDRCSELTCPQCKHCYNTNTQLPLVLPDTLTNICKSCYSQSTRCYSANGDPLVNETLLELIRYLNTNHFTHDDSNNNSNSDSDNSTRTTQLSKDKEDKILTKVEFVYEYITIIAHRYNEFNENCFKFQQALQTNVNTKEFKAKLFKKLPKFLSDLNKHYSSIKTLLDKIQQYTKDSIEDYNTWKELVMTYIDQLTTCLNSANTNAVNSIDILSIEKAIIVQSDKLMTAFAAYDTVIELLPVKSCSQSKNSSFCSAKNDMSFNSHLPSSRPSITNVSSSLLTPSSSSAAFTRTELSLPKDTIVFIKNKLKQPILNCSGYAIGDEGCKMILKLTLQSIFNSKHNVDTTNQEPVVYSELKLSKCAIGNDGVCYLNMFINVTNHTISIVNLSHNLISNKAENELCALIKKNARNLRMVILSDNLLSVGVAEKIIRYGKRVSPRLKIDI